MAKGYSMSKPARLVTAEELEKFPDDDFRYELVEGQVVRMSPVGYVHARIVMRFGSLLEQHVRNRRLGAILTELGCKLRSDPDTVRAPDLAFIRRERIPSVDPRGFWNGPPDLAVEVLSPDDTAPEIAEKTSEYLAAGVRLVVVVDPEERAVSLYSEAASVISRRGDESLDLGGVIPGFHCRVREIFE